MKQAVIYANGRLLPSFLKDLSKNDLVIGVDQAAFWLIRHGVVPRAAVGDFDSVTAAEMAEIRKKIPEIIEFPSQKDETDLNLAVGYAVRLKMSHIIIYGGIGSRLDHTMAAFTLLETYKKQGVSITLRDEGNEVFLLDGFCELARDATYRYLSVIPVTRSATVTIKGVKYPVAGRIFERGSTLGISNEIAASSASIFVHKGKILVIRSRD